MKHLFGIKHKIIYIYMSKFESYNVSIKFKNLPHLEFVKKEKYDDFLPNRKYILIHGNYVFIVIYRINKFATLEYSGFDTQGCLEKYDVKKRYTYYEIISKKKEIQDAMERRCVNLIIQQIIGDKFFVW